MNQRLFTEILPIYKSKNNNPYAIRIRMRMTDPVDSAMLRNAVDTTMKRYPYFWTVSEILCKSNLKSRRYNNHKITYTKKFTLPKFLPFSLTQTD